MLDTSQKGKLTGIFHGWNVLAPPPRFSPERNVLIHLFGGSANNYLEHYLGLELELYTRERLRVPGVIPGSMPQLKHHFSDFKNSQHHFRMLYKVICFFLTL